MRISLRRRLASAAMALGVASAGLLGSGAAPAQAAADDCPSGYFCAWKTTDGTGPMFKTNKNLPTLGTWNNTFRRIVNRTDQFVCGYDQADYGFAKGYKVLKPRSIPTTMEPGYISSLKFVATVPECESTAYPSWVSQASPKPAGFGDMNADRKADILVRDSSGRLWFLPGDGTGRQIGSGWNGMNALVRHGDFSRDGREDVIAREAATGKLWLYPGTGTGGLGTRKLLGSGGWNGMSRIAAYGDLSGDGRADLLAVEKSTGKLWLYPGTSTGGLGTRKLLGSGGWNGMNALVGAGDMNGDGRADLVAREAATGKLWLYPGAAGHLAARKLIGSGGWNDLEYLVAVGDWSADGRADLLAVRGNWLIDYRGLGNGGLRPGERNNTTWGWLNGTF
ncbi:FG-GAP-like repeat-containing protein [Streptomyces sp. NPDC091278]|uniref:FG-GAP-like repeat-containing protein n=1 Tax=Streptomyces sp. NPDC091278 TaxID=3155301 RepID=UPI00344D18AC